MAAVHSARSRSRCPEYTCWKSMIARCYRSSNASWKYYGAKGIGVCERWRLSFEDFSADMGPRPSSSHQLDRIDNAKGYEPGNVRWATASEQAWNTSKCRYLTFKGETKCVGEWADETGISPRTITSRIDRFGWSVEKALTTPPHKGNKVRTNYPPLKKTKKALTINGVTHSANHWAKIFGVPPARIYYWLKTGKTPEEILSRVRGVQVPPPVLPPTTPALNMF